MELENQLLSTSVVALRPFVPATDFKVSHNFYIDVGFEAFPLGDDLASMHLGSFSFLLQDYRAEGFAGNFMMHLLVKDLDLWWKHIDALNLATRYNVRPPTAPKLQPWGLTVTYLVDPSGVLWHIAQERAKDTSEPG